MQLTRKRGLNFLLTNVEWVSANNKVQQTAEIKKENILMFKMLQHYSAQCAFERV